MSLQLAHVDRNTALFIHIFIILSWCLFCHTLEEGTAINLGAILESRQFKS